MSPGTHSSLHPAALLLEVVWQDLVLQLQTAVLCSSTSKNVCPHYFCWCYWLFKHGQSFCLTKSHVSQLIFYFQWALKFQSRKNCSFLFCLVLFGFFKCSGGILISSNITHTHIIRLTDSGRGWQTEGRTKSSLWTVVCHVPALGGSDGSKGHCRAPLYIWICTNTLLFGCR